jgi:zinc protease
MYRLTALFAILIAHLVYAQDDKATFLDAPLTLDPTIRTGQLDNGMVYYIKQNKKPENRAELRLVVNAGSILEKDNQQGLAHFVEHMAFNGTKNFKKSEIVDYLEGIGVKFGAHLNAYTSFDETVYMIQIPTDSQAIMDKGFLILRDWADGVAFEGEEIDKERGVVTEEWRLGRGAQARMRDQWFPVIFKDSRYALRLPIGKKEIIQEADHETFREFYRDWYRPDLMAVIAVGDFDVDEVEARIKEQFGAIPKGEPSVRTMYQVPDHKETLVSVATDKEADYTAVQLIYKHDTQEEKLVKDYRQFLVQSLYNEMLNMRLGELRQSENPPFLYAYGYYSSLVRTKDAFFSTAVTKQDELLKGLKAVVLENERVKQFGFTASELARAKKELINSYDRSYNERAKTESRSFASEYVRHFLNNEPAPGITLEHAIATKYTADIKLEEVNALAKKWITEENLAIVVTAPEKDGVKMPTEMQILGVLKEARGAKIKAYVDEVVDQPLLADLPEAGAVTSTKELKELGLTQFTLSNGAKVIIKPTTFKQDQIMMRAISPGGHSNVADADHLSATMVTRVINQSGAGAFSNVDLQKMMAGNSAWVQPWVSELEEGISGGCRPTDLESMFQLTHLYLTSPRKDKTAFSTTIKTLKDDLENKGADPNQVYSDSSRVTLSNYHQRRQVMTTKRLSEIDHGKIMEIYVNRFADISDFTFVLVGNVDGSTCKPLLEKYIGSLPGKGRKESWVDLGIKPPKGQVKKTVKKGLEPKARVTLTFHGKFDWSYQERFDLDAMVRVLRIKLRESMREDMGGVYGVGVRAAPRKYPNGAYSLKISWGCAPESVDALIAAAIKEIKTLQTEGPVAGDLEKVRKMLSRERETNLESNRWWMSAITQYYRHGDDPNIILDHAKYVEGLNGEAVKISANKYFNLDQYIQMVLLPE